MHARWRHNGRCMTTSSTHAKKKIQMDTFHGGLKPWMDLYRHCVCPGSYLKYAFLIYKAKLWQLNRGFPVAILTYLICIMTRGLCSYNARLFNDDVTAIGVSYWRRREFPNYARLHRGRMYHTWMLNQHHFKKCLMPGQLVYVGYKYYIQLGHPSASILIGQLSRWIHHIYGYNRNDTNTNIQPKL